MRVFILHISLLDERRNATFKHGKEEKKFAKREGAKSGRIALEIFKKNEFYLCLESGQESGRIVTWQLRQPLLTSCFPSYISCFGCKISSFLLPPCPVLWREKQEKTLHFLVSIFVQILSFNWWIFKLLRTRSR